MQKISKRNNNSPIAGKELNSACPDKKKENKDNFVEILPPEVTSKIFSQLDIQSLCRAATTCKSWNQAIKNCDYLWKHHCLTVRAICQKEIDVDRGKGYSWRVTLLRNYRRSKVKHEWLSGRYSNICSPVSLPEKNMCPMDADTWGRF